MKERQLGSFNVEKKPQILSEISRPYSEEFTLFDYKDALLVDKKVVLAYKHFWVSKQGLGDKILVARERTIPLKIEHTGREVIHPYPNEEELKGRYGVLIIGVRDTRPIFYISEQYKVIFDGSFVEKGLRCADITIESTKPLDADFINGNIDYNNYLYQLNARGCMGNK